MYLSKLLVPLAGCALAAAALGGCTFGVEGSVEPPIRPVPVVPPASRGALSVTWLVVGTADPALCSAWGVSALELVVYDSAGSPLTTVNAPCSSFSVSLSLPEGRYTADATLIGAASNPVSTTKRLERLDVIAGTEITSNLNFPRESML